MSDNEMERLEEVYKDRKEKNLSTRYSLFQKGTLQQIQERERVLLEMLKKTIGTSVVDKRVLDIGCGDGGTLFPMLYYGFQAENCFGIDLQADRINQARKKLPNMIFACCSAEDIPFEKGKFDLVMTFTCLTMIIDKKIRETVCRQVLEMLKPGGWILNYEPRVNNPRYPSIKAVSLNELKGYFPGLKYFSKTLTLVPPLGRAVGKHSVTVCNLLSIFPFLRTHRMTMFQKPLS